MMCMSKSMLVFAAIVPELNDENEIDKGEVCREVGLSIQNEK